MKARDKAAIQEMLAGGADTRATDNLGKMAIHYAAETGDVDVCRLLIELGSPLNAPTNGRHRPLTPLVIASFYGHAEVVELLLRMQDKQGVQAAQDRIDALYEAVSARQKGPIAILLEHKVPYDQKSSTGGSAFELAASFSDAETMRMFMDVGTSIPLWSMARLGMMKEVENEIKNGADVMKTSPAGETPLQYGVRSGNVELVKILLEAGATPNGMAVRRDRMSPLHDAAQVAGSEMVSLLIKHGADVNQTEAIGRTPLHFAVMRGDLHICKVLLDAGANVVERPDRQESLFHLARNKPHILELLRKYQK